MEIQWWEKKNIHSQCEPSMLSLPSSCIPAILVSAVAGMQDVQAPEICSCAPRVAGLFFPVSGTCCLYQFEFHQFSHILRIEHTQTEPERGFHENTVQTAIMKGSLTSVTDN